MDILLWRHGETELTAPDHQRSLSAKGHKQVWKMAGWLDQHLPNGCKILVSPTMCTVQTAQALGRKSKIVEALGPDGTPDQLLNAAKWPLGREPVLVVGHQPAMGNVASILLTGTSQDWTLRKASVIWISQRDRDDGPGTFLRAVMAPEFIGK